jgi:nitroreductase
MNVDKAIKTRRSIRAYLDKPVEEEKLRAVLLAGTYAPSAMNNQNRIIVAITGATAKEKLNAAVEAEADEATRERICARNGGVFDFFYGAPVLIAVLSTDGLYPEADCATAIENMALACRDLNLGSCWINQLTRTQNAKVKTIFKRFGVSDDAVIYGCLAVGYAAREGEKKDKSGKVIIVK